MTSTGKRILLVEDDRFLRRACEASLRQRGYTVTTAGDGEEGLRLARTERPDLVLLDMLMPKLSGLDALRAMRERGLAMPAVLLSAISDSSMRELEGIEAPDAILEKPFKKRTIEEALAKATRKER